MHSSEPDGPVPVEPASVEPVSVDTVEGPGRFHVSPAADPVATLVLGHGAGGGVDATDLAILAAGLPAAGVTVVRFEQPWRTAGGRVAVRPPRLDLGWNDALVALLDGTVRLPGVDPERPLVTGGRSAGARVACRTAADGPLAGQVAGVVCCAFPLHLPGRPERSRAPELLAPEVPRLVCQGERDTFGRADELAAVIGPDDPVELVRIPGADHSMRLPRRSDRSVAFGAGELRTLLVGTVSRFVLDVAGPTGNRGGTANRARGAQGRGAGDEERRE